VLEPSHSIYHYNGFTFVFKMNPRIPIQESKKAMKIVKYDEI